MTNSVKNEIARCETRANTLRLLDAYLRNHVGESFTCRDLREKSELPVSSNVMAAFLNSHPAAFGVRLSVSQTTIHCETPIKVSSWGGRVTYIESYEVNLYTVEGLDDSWANW